MLPVTTLAVCSISLASVLSPAKRDADFVAALQGAGYETSDQLQIHVEPSWWFTCEQAERFAFRWTAGVINAGFGSDPGSFSFACPEPTPCPCADASVCVTRWTPER